MLVRGLDSLYQAGSDKRGVKEKTNSSGFKDKVIAKSTVQKHDF